MITKICSNPSPEIRMKKSNGCSRPFYVLTVSSLPKVPTYVYPLIVKVIVRAPLGSSTLRVVYPVNMIDAWRS